MFNAFGVGTHYGAGRSSASRSASASMAGKANGVSRTVQADIRALRVFEGEGAVRVGLGLRSYSDCLQIHTQKLLINTVPVPAKLDTAQA